MKTEPKYTALALVAALLTLSVNAALAEPSRGSQGAAAALAEAAVASDNTDLTMAERIAADDGEWLVDEAGMQYRVAKLPKIEGGYKLTENNQVIMPLGVRFEIIKQDDEWFWVKQLKPRINTTKRKKKETGPSAEELAAINAYYDVAGLEESDRLSFEEFGRGLPRSGQWRNGFDIADMNDDEHLDIVFGPRRKGRMRPNIFLGDGAGNWRLWREARYPQAAYDYGDVEVADFNADGHMDMAFGIHLRGLLVLVGDGAGKFNLWTEGINLQNPGHGGDISAFSSRAITSLDWNGDDKLDILAFGEGPKGTGSRMRGLPNQMDSASRGFFVYLNKGDGSWHPWRPLQGENLRPNFGDGFEVVDLNKDGYMDMVTVSRQIGSKDILRYGREGGRIEIGSLDEVPFRAMVTAVHVADLNDDGNEDLVLGYMNREGKVWRTGIDLLFGSADLTWTRQPLFSEETRRGVTALTTGNLDADGKPDLVALTGRGETWVFLRDDQGGFVHEKETLTPSELGCQGYGLTLIDLDGDGRDEVVASYAGEPTGMPGMPSLNHPGCRNEGSVRVWKNQPSS